MVEELFRSRYLVPKGTYKNRPIGELSNRALIGLIRRYMDDEELRDACFWQLHSRIGDAVEIMKLIDS